MPEGDSVLRLARRMQTKTAGTTVVATDLRWPSCATVSFGGALIAEWATHGKHLLTRFTDGRTLHTHLGMDGSWTVVRAGKQLPSHVETRTRVRLGLEDGRAAYGLDLKAVDVVPTTDEHRLIGHLGPDLLAAEFDLDAATQRVSMNIDRPAGETLLDQRTVAGLGNAWVVELLFLRGIHPDCPIGDVDVPATLTLARRMMQHSVEFGTGQTTTGIKKRGENHWVYGRAGRPCRRCGTPIAFRVGDHAVLARETWWCPHCQFDARGNSADRVPPSTQP